MKKFSLQLFLIGCVLRGTLILGAGLMLVQPCAADSGVFINTGNLATARDRFPATLLPDGRVLAAGGLDNTGSALASVELYDPASGAWAPTGNLGTARDRDPAILLLSGQVLVAGGLDSAGNPLASVELYDPASGIWTPTGSLAAGGSHSKVTLLANGQVLAAAGLDSAGNVLASAELYDPASGTWAPTGNLGTARDRLTATLLPNGQVLVAGGLDNTGNALASAELYDPASGTWAPTGSLGTARYGHGAILLRNGQVLVAGGLDSAGNALASAELYDPVGGTWAPTGSLGTARTSAPVTLLLSGQVLVGGGLDNTGSSLASAELYDPVGGTWAPTGSLNTARDHHAAELLPNGEVLVAGGLDSTGNALASAELYVPAPPVITSPLVATATANLPFSYQFEAMGAQTLAVDEATLPPGLTFDSSLSAIVGSTTAEGTFQVALSASNTGGTTDATLVLTVQPFPAAGPVLMNVTSATGRTGSPFRFQIFTSGGSSAASVRATGLPTGLSLDSGTGEITGAVTMDGSFSVMLSVTEAGITNTATLQLTFTSDLAVPVIVSPNSANVFPGLPFNYTIEAPSSDLSDPVTYSKVGPLPAGLGLDQDTGIISGTPKLGFNSSLPGPHLAGGVVTNTQIFACNSSGCAAQSLFFLLPTGAANISTRLSVGTNDDVLIGGFITQGNAPMKLVIRADGPSLPLGGLLADPFVDLYSGPTVIASNDNWKDNLAGGSQEVAIENTGLAPANDLESAILAALQPGAYTAVMRGNNNGTGVGLVEVYNLGAASLDVSSNAQLGNISTRGHVQTGDNVMIGGFINQGATPIKVVVRALGPELGPLGVKGVLADPMLELHKPDGTIIMNDSWMEDPAQKAEIMATGYAPSDPLEPAIVLTLPVGEGAYTAIVRGANNTTGVALVEAYFGDPCLGTSCP